MFVERLGRRHPSQRGRGRASGQRRGRTCGRDNRRCRNRQGGGVHVLILAGEAAVGGSGFVVCLAEGGVGLLAVDGVCPGGCQARAPQIVLVTNVLQAGGVVNGGGAAGGLRVQRELEELQGDRNGGFDHASEGVVGEVLRPGVGAAIDAGDAVEVVGGVGAVLIFGGVAGVGVGHALEGAVGVPGEVAADGEGEQRADSRPNGLHSAVCGLAR